jgi:hypothetical protein
MCTDLEERDERAADLALLLLLPPPRDADPHVSLDGVSISPPPPALPPPPRASPPRWLLLLDGVPPYDAYRPLPAPVLGVVAADRLPSPAEYACSGRVRVTVRGVGAMKRSRGMLLHPMPLLGFKPEQKWEPDHILRYMCRKRKKHRTDAIADPPLP